MPLRKAAWLIACIRFGAKSIHALDFEIAENAMMTVAPVRISKELSAEEQEDIAYGHAIPVKVGLSSARLPKGAVPILEQRVVMAQARP